MKLKQKHGLAAAHVVALASPQVGHTRAGAGAKRGWGDATGPCPRVTGAVAARVGAVPKAHGTLEGKTIAGSVGPRCFAVTSSSQVQRPQRRGLGTLAQVVVRDCKVAGG